MARIDEVMSSIVKALNEQTSRIFVRVNYDFDKEKLIADNGYPYGTVSITSAYIPETNNIPATDYFEDSGTWRTRVSEQPTMSMTINCLSDDETEAMDLLNQVIAAFKLAKRDQLINEGISIVSFDSSGDRTFLREVAYEYVYGVDVTVRYNNVITVETPYAESAIIDIEGEEKEYDLGGA